MKADKNKTFYFHWALEEASKQNLQLWKCFYLWSLSRREASNKSLEIYGNLTPHQPHRRIWTEIVSNFGDYGF